MKKIFTISICANLVLLGGLIFFMASKNRQRRENAATPSFSAEDKLSSTVVAQSSIVSGKSWLQSFHWNQLESTNDYRRYVANLRTIGCPEATIEDIVNGDANRAFAFKRNQLRLDGAGTGPWSQYRERQLVATLLGKSAANPAAVGSEAAETVKINPVQSTQQGQLAQSNTAQTPSPKQTLPVQKTVQPVYPLAFREVNLASLGFGAAQKAAISRVRQQFVSDIGGPNQNPSDPAYLAKWQSAQARADDTLRGLLGNQAFMAYQQQQYYSWFKPQIVAAAAAARRLEINPATFSSAQ